MFFPRSGWSNRIGLLVIVVAALLIILERFLFWPGGRSITTILYTWTLLLAGFALLLGVANVLWIHLRRIQQGQEEWGFSLLLVIILLGVLAAGLVSPGGTTGTLMEWVFDSMISPGQASLFALTAFFILAAAFRFLRLTQPGGVWIVFGAFLIFAVQTPMLSPEVPSLLASLADWVLVWPVMAALRGALLGAGLAAVIAGIRLMAQNK